MQGKIKWKKNHACRVDQEKNFCNGLPHILQKSQEGMQESIRCAKTSAFWIETSGSLFVWFCLENGTIITQIQYSVRNCWGKQQKLANLWHKRYFKNELKHSKRFDQVTDDVTSLFWSWKNYQVKHYFPANFLCLVIKSWLSTALGLVSRLFRSC